VSLARALFVLRVWLGRRAINGPLAGQRCGVVGAGLAGAEQRFQAIGDLPVGRARPVLVISAARSLSWLMPAIRLRGETPVSAARVFPVWRRSWKAWWCAAKGAAPSWSEGEPQSAVHDHAKCVDTWNSTAI
jgi:hypothetical protein